VAPKAKSERRSQKTSQHEETDVNPQLRATALAAGWLVSGAALATNGMQMEGYGPASLAMGGASMAYDNGTAAMMNNPATLQLASPGTRADLALGLLGPNVTSMGEKSGGTSYWMPAFGWVRTQEQYSYGVGVFGQGGMGTEYPASSMNAAGTSQPVRSELAVGRVIFPVAYKLNSAVNLGATLDYSWASLDMRMGALFSQMAGMNPVPTGQFAPMMGAIMQGQMPAPPAVRIDFSDNNSFSGAAKSSGWTGKLGATFDLANDLRLGVAYQMKTRLADMKTSATGATLTLGQALPGQMTIHDFQMPSSLAAGLSWQARPGLMLVADVKRIDWASAMQSFKMTFLSSQGLGSMSFALPQNWKDQTVVSLGGAYKVDERWVARAGYSHSSNPVPDAYVNPLFPAIVKDHYTAGFGYSFSPQWTLDAAVSHAPKVSVTSGMGAAITHSQTNYQLMLSRRY
jgi:long-chain fatty acid transport protein